MQKHYTPAVEQALEARLQARRAREMARTAQTTSKELKVAQEALKELRTTTRQMIEMIGQGGPVLELAQQRVRERLDSERARLDQAKQHSHDADRGR
jgi:multidrug resistance efflux pump